ncbi:MAG: MarR family transcriptional regulator [Spirochaetales bacterium]|uniref:MarR family transcriptional regulator n=1 Tax=Candidatus Thalassospirochaeta sargassi TaxID=3119039 RepID=A0AAJ1MJY5_9SPIO|nr:MarR family transcriptional regulator [Spirochaetales bacterium]
MIELILELKQRCRFDSEIGQSLNLREKEITFLSAIANESDITSKHLSTLAGLSPSRASRVISALHEKGFIIMKHDETDRRLVKLRLTQKGKDCVKGINREKEQCENDLLNGLSENERETVKQGLNILLKKM